SEQPSRKDSLVGELSYRLLALAVLPLSSLFLQLFIGHRKTKLTTPDNDTHAIRVREVVFEVDRHLRRRSAVCVVLFNRRIEISIGIGESCVETQRGSRPAVFGDRIGSLRAE